MTTTPRWSVFLLIVCAAACSASHGPDSPDASLGFDASAPQNDNEDGGGAEPDGSEPASPSLPSVRIVSPRVGAVLSGTVRVELEVTGSLGQLALRSNGELVGQAASTAKSLEWKSCSSVDGAYTLRVDLRDGQGRTVSDEVAVTLDNLQGTPVLRGRAGDGSNRLDWSLCGAFASYQVYWSITPGVTDASAKLASEQLYIVHRNATDADRYHYRVAAVGAARHGPLSNEIVLTASELPPRVCSAAGWCSDWGPPQGETLGALWGQSDDQVVAVGRSTAIQWDGLGWNHMPDLISGFPYDTLHVWGSAPDDIWLAGSQLQHWNGHTWEAGGNISTASAGIWGNGANDVWIAGSGTFSRWNGVSWTSFDDGQLDKFHVADVWTDGANVWVAGNGVHGEGGSVLRYDGKATSILLTKQQYTRAIWGSGPEDVWAVGEFGTIHHWNGQDWVSTQIGIEHVRDVHGCAADDVWAVGHFGLALHWNGKSWSDRSPPTRTNLRAVWCGATRTWVVGERGETLSWSKDTGWSTPGAEHVGPLRAIAPTAAGPMIVGEYETILRRDEQGWKRLRGTLADRYPNVDLNDIHGTAEDDLWAVGNSGSIVHWNGNLWQAQESVTTYGLEAIWALAPNDVWAAGDEGTLLHFDGNSWRPHSSGTTVTTYDLWGSGSNDVWAVGWDGITHWDGTSWSTPPESGIESEHTEAVWGSGPEDVWTKSLEGKVRRWNGRSWTTQDLGPSTSGIGSVHGTGPDNVYVFHWQWYAHWNGLGWQRTDWGSDFNPTNGRVAANGDLWLVGAYGSRHWNGASWSSAPTPSPRAFRGMHLLDSDTVYTVGEAGTISKWAGAEWNIESPTPASSQHLGDLWVESETSIWYVGDYGAIRHWDGSTAWQEHESGTLAQLFAITGSGPGDIWAAGEGGTLLHYDGVEWQQVVSGTQLPILDLVTVSHDNVLAVAGEPIGGGNANYDGTILRWNGSNWDFDSVPNVPSLIGIWAEDSENIWAVGDYGTIVQWDGKAWREVSSPAHSTDTLNGVWGRDAEHVWAVGTGGLIMRWTGVTWEVEAAPTHDTLLSVGGNEEALWAVGSEGTILRRAQP